jgi:hypothetical protein
MALIVAVVITSCIVSFVGYLRWRSWLKYLDKAGERGADALEAAADAGAKYPMPLEESAASVAEIVLRRARPP